MTMRGFEGGRVRRSWLSRQVSRFLCLTLLVEMGPAMALPAGGELAQAAPPPARLITQEPPNPPGMTAAAPPAGANRIVRASSGTPGVDPGWNLVSLLRQP